MLMDLKKPMMGIITNMMEPLKELVKVSKAPKEIASKPNGQKIVLLIPTMSEVV